MGFKGTLGKIVVGRNARPPSNAVPAAPAAPIAPIAPTRPPWDASLFRIRLKLAKSRIEIQRGRKENEILTARQTIAEHLRNNKEVLARIHAERVLRETTQLQVFDVVHTFIALLTNSHTVFSVQSNFDSAGTDIKEAVATIVYASSRMNIPELHVIRDMFRAHFGPAVIDPLTRIEGPNVGRINSILARNLESTAPDEYLILQELTKIASDYNVSWIPPPEFSDLDGGTSGDAGYYRPFPLASISGGPNFPHNPSAPPPDYGGGAYAPTNIPGHNPYPSAAPYGGAMGAGSMMPPPGPSMGTQPPPYDPSDTASGTLYPSAPPSSSADSQGPPAMPPPPPPSNFFTDDELASRYANMRDNY